MTFKLVENANIIFETESFKEFEDNARLELSNILNQDSDLQLISSNSLNKVLSQLEDNEILTYFNSENIKL